MVTIINLFDETYFYIKSKTNSHFIKKFVAKKQAFYFWLLLFFYLHFLYSVSSLRQQNQSEAVNILSLQILELYWVDSEVFARGYHWEAAKICRDLVSFGSLKTKSWDFLNQKSYYIFHTVFERRMGVS